VSQWFEIDDHRRQQLQGVEEGATGTGGRGGAGDQLDFLNQILLANENKTSKRTKAQGGRLGAWAVYLDALLIFQLLFCSII
jgi:hypothetical protein